MEKEMLQGVVKRALTGKEGGSPYAFIITGDDGLEYFAHLGDLKENEYKLYKNSDDDTQFLTKDDRVEFNCFTSERYIPAINVRRVL